MKGCKDDGSRAMSRSGAQPHFDSIAGSYRALRVTDDEPVLHINRLLSERPLVGVDIGAGTGRYTERLLKLAPTGSFVVAADLNGAMVDKLVRNIARRGIHALRCDSEQLALSDGSVDFLTTFNAVHHFDLASFVAQAGLVLKPGGDLFVYTRTPAQNAASIWGRLFPGFAARETRLWSESQLRDALCPLGPVQTTTFSFTRRATPARLAEQARGRHYSTFSLYDHDELTSSLDEFLEALGNTEEVTWADQNLLVHARIPL